MPEEPHYCRREAYDLFTQQVPRLSERGALLRAATAIAMHQLEGTSVEAVEQRIDDLARRIRERVQVPSPRALLAHAHEVLFEEENFVGNVHDYYNPQNSYVPVVLETQRGIPITLSLIYKEVLERLDLTVHGLNAPGHFLTRVQLESEDMLVDVFYGGRILTRDEALTRIRSVVGDNNPLPLTFEEATPDRWLSRMLKNLQIIFQQSHASENLAAMLELQHSLESV